MTTLSGQTILYWILRLFLTFQLLSLVHANANSICIEEKNRTAGIYRAFCPDEEQKFTLIHKGAVATNKSQEFKAFLLKFLDQPFLTFDAGEILGRFGCDETFECVRSALACVKETHTTRLCLYQQAGSVQPANRDVWITGQDCGFLASCEEGTDTSLCPSPSGCSLVVVGGSGQTIYTYIYYFGSDDRYGQGLGQLFTDRRTIHLDVATFTLPHSSLMLQFLIGFEVFPSSMSPPTLNTWNHTECWHRKNITGMTEAMCPTPPTTTTEPTTTTLVTTTETLNTTLSTSLNTTLQGDTNSTDNTTLLNTTTLIPPTNATTTEEVTTTVTTTLPTTSTTRRVLPTVTTKDHTEEPPAVVAGPLNEVEWIVIWSIVGVLAFCGVLIVALLSWCVHKSKTKKKRKAQHLAPEPSRTQENVDNSNNQRMETTRTQRNRRGMIRDMRTEESILYNGGTAIKESA